MAELAGRADENAAARADEREALSAIFDGISLMNDERVDAPLDLDAGADDATLFEPGDKAVLQFELSPEYPLDAPATASVAWATAYRVPSSIKDHVDAAVAAALAASSGDAAIYSAVAAANDALNEEAERHAAAYASWRSAAPPVTSREIVEWEGTELTRRLIYSHHIIAPSKRSGLRECAQILGVTTLVKIGWPGAICLEGPKDRVDAFVNHITRWRWKQLAVRGEQDAEERALPRIFLETSDMSTFAGHLRAAGLQELFLRLFK